MMYTHTHIHSLYFVPNANRSCTLQVYIIYYTRVITISSKKKHKKTRTQITLLLRFAYWTPRRRRRRRRRRHNRARGTKERHSVRAPAPPRNVISITRARNKNNNKKHMIDRRLRPVRSKHTLWFKTSAVRAHPSTDRRVYRNMDFPVSPPRTTRTERSTAIA